MSARLEKAAQRLAVAACRYGDVKAERERLLRAWKRGDPPFPSFPADVERELLSAARAYATANRAVRKRLHKAGRI